MKRADAEKYVQTYARYMRDAPNTPYFVRWPNPYATKVFFSDDTADLVEQILKFANYSKEGRRMSHKE